MSQASQVSKVGDADDDDVQVAPTFVEDHESIDDPVMPPPPDFKNDKKEDWFDDPVLPVLPVGAAKIEHHDDKADSNTNKSEPGLDLNETLLLGQHDYSRITLQLTAMTSELEERNAQIVLLKKKEEHFEQAMLEREALLKQMTQRLQAQDEKHRQEQAATMRSLGAAQDALDRQREETNEKISKELQNQKSSHDAAMRDLQGQLCAAITQSSNHDCQRELARRGYAFPPD